MKQRTITITELREMNVSTHSVKDNSPRGMTTKSTADVVIGDKVVLDNYSTLVVEDKGVTQ